MHKNVANDKMATGPQENTGWPCLKSDRMIEAQRAIWRHDGQVSNTSYGLPTLFSV